MGGHGGLNILPQKSWNVWRQDNREQVLKDEREHREKQEEIKKKHDKAEREFRRNLLLARARGSDRVGDEACGLLDTERPEERSDDSGDHKRAGPSSGTQRFDLGIGNRHINLFGLSDSKDAAETEKLDKEREEARKRGRADQRTSDPRFDARFQLGYEMGPEHQPWWVDGGRAAEQRRQLELARKEAEELRAGSSAGMLQRGAATKEDLQRERVLREQAERTRVRKLLADKGLAVAERPEPRGGARYHSGYHVAPERGQGGGRGGRGEESGGGVGREGRGSPTEEGGWDGDRRRERERSRGRERDRSRERESRGRERRRERERSREGKKGRDKKEERRRDKARSRERERERNRG